MNCKKRNASQWMGCRVMFSATRDGRRVDSIEIAGCLAVFDRSRDLAEQARAAVVDWQSRQERVHGHRYQDTQITYLEVETPDGRYLDATKLGWGVLAESQQVAMPPARERSELESALIQAIEASGYSVSGPTDSRAAELGEPTWVCNARAALAQSAAMQPPIVVSSDVQRGTGANATVEVWRSTLSVGTEVFWTDPDNGTCSGCRIIAEIMSDSGMVESDETQVRLTAKGSVTEAYAGELSPVKRGEGGNLPESSEAVEVCIRAAKQHGDDDDPDHEVGDLQDCLREMWVLLTPDQRNAYMSSESVIGRLELGLYSEEFEALYPDRYLQPERPHSHAPLQVRHLIEKT